MMGAVRGKVDQVVYWNAAKCVAPVVLGMLVVGIYRAYPMLRPVFK